MRLPLTPETNTPLPHLLHFVRVQIQEVILLEADKVKGRPGPAADDADALAKLQGVLEPRDVLWVQLGKGMGRTFSVALGLLAGTSIVC